MPAKVFIETPRLILRDWQETDNEAFINLSSDAAVMEFFPSVFTAPQTLAQIERMTGHINQYGYGFFAVERKDNGQFIGFTGLFHPRFDSCFTPCVEIGWRLSKANWGQGFATEAAQACLQFGFNDLNLNEIYSFTSIHNLKSERVMQKIGMAHAGFFEHPSLDDGHWLKRHALYKAVGH